MSQYFGTALPGTTKNIAYTGTFGTIASGISNGVNRARIFVTSDAFVTTDGSTPTSSNGMPIAANSPEYLTVISGQVVKAVQITAGGTLYVTECV